MKRSILMMMLVAMLGMAFVIPAQAAISWECTFDFTASDGGWENADYVAQDPPLQIQTFGAHTGGVGWQAEYKTQSLGATIGGLIIKREIESDTTITGFAFTGSWQVTTFDGTRTDAAAKNSTTTGYLWSQSPGAKGTNVTSEERETTFSSPEDFVSGDEFNLLLFYRRTFTNTANSGFLTITSVRVEGTGTTPFTEGTGIACDILDGYTRPYAAEDFHRFGMFNNSNIVNPQGIFAVSNVPNAHVSAPLDGTVDLVRKASIGDCEIFIGSSFFTACTVNFPAVINGTSTDYLHGLTGVNPGVTGDITPWLVRITSDTTRFFYMVENADKYVVEGQTVTAGCWIGESMRLTTSTLDLGVGVGADGPNAGFDLGRGYADYGLTIITVLEGGTRVDALEDFTEQPTINAPCNLPEGFEGCEGDSSLSTPGQWTSIDSQWRESGGVTISAGGYIKSQMNLDPAREPGLKVGVRAIGSNTTLALKLGEAAETVSVTASSGFTRVTIEPDEHNPDGSFYTIEIKNTGSGAAELNYVCVYHSKDGEGNPIEPPDGPEDSPNEDNALCKFADYSFDSSSAWTISSGEAAVGEIRIPASATVSQSVSVPAGTYTLSIVASVWHYNAFTPDDTDTDTITFEYDFPADTTYTTISAKTFGQYAENNNSMVHSVSLVLGSDTSGTFTFRPVFSDTPTNVRGVIVRSICIGSEQSGTGGQSGSGTGDSDWEGPFETSCTAISTPTGSSAIGTWARWFWAKLNGFFQCELMVILNSTYNSINRLVLTVGWSIRWGHEFARLGTTWFSRDFTLWLGGQIANMGGATLSVGDTVYGNVSASLPDWIWDPVSFGMQAGNATRDAIEEGKSITDVLLDTLQPIRDVIEAISNLVNLAFNFLFDVVPRLVRIGYNVVVGIFNNIGAFFDLILQLFQSYNDAEPQPIAGVMQCAVNPKENPVCIMLWVLEHTVFSGRGYLLIPFVVVYWTVLLVIWTVQRVSVKLRGSMQAV